MTNAYEKVLLSQLRLAAYRPGSAELVDDGLLAKAMTVNENLQALGYTLSPADVVRLAASESLDGFYDRIAGMTDQVKAKPMYPDFPKQVMAMEEAQFRFHQMLHYLSTYGLETLFGERVTRGWLPQMKETEKTVPDERLLASKVIELVGEKDVYVIPAQRVLAKRERMTLPEQEIVAEAAQHMTQEELSALNVPFKENLFLIAEAVMRTGSGEAAGEILRALCKHTGDVLDCTAYLLKKNRWHLRTSQKRMLVRLIERYPVEDWKANVILSTKKAQRSLMLLEHLSYSAYSRSPVHMAVVDSLRDGELRSWESRAKALVEQGDKGALAFIGARPGMLLRMTAWLLRMGYAPEEIAKQLCAGAASLSVQTLVTVLNFFGGRQAASRAEAEQVYAVMEAALAKRLSLSDTPLRGKKVFLDEGGMMLAVSTLQCSGKSAEGGYVASGTVYRIPEGVRYVRFFTYWNDPMRVDVDLHVRARNIRGEDICVGWNAAYCNAGVVFSGDITHSDAAEYIDVDLESGLSRVAFNIHLFSGKEGFGQIETCLTGLQAVKNIGEAVALYSPENCFFSANLRSSCRTMQYGYLDVQNRMLVFDGVPLEEAPSQWYRLDEAAHSVGKMNIARYLELLFEAQGCEVVASREEAEVVLVIEKPMEEKEISLIDNNYFMDAKT